MPVGRWSAYFQWGTWASKEPTHIICAQKSSEKVRQKSRSGVSRIFISILLQTRKQIVCSFHPFRALLANHGKRGRQDAKLVLFYVEHRRQLKTGCRTGQEQLPDPGGAVATVPSRASSGEESWFLVGNHPAVNTQPTVSPNPLLHLRISYLFADILSFGGVWILVVPLFHHFPTLILRGTSIRKQLVIEKE